MIATSPVKVLACSASSLFFSSPRRDSSWASNIQYSATFSYALLMTVPLLAPRAVWRRPLCVDKCPLSDDIRGASSNAPNHAASAALVSWSLAPPLTQWALVTSPGPVSYTHLTLPKVKMPNAGNFIIAYPDRI